MNTSPFNNSTSEYDSWFDKNKSVYNQELETIRQLIPESGRGVEIGAGTGRFTAPSGIKIGIEPSLEMGLYAKARGLEVIGGVAESLPLLSGTFDFVLFVTVICFLDSFQRSVDEAFRILKKNGALIIAFIEKDSYLGKFYERKKEKDKFYEKSRFFSVKEVNDVMKRCGFASFEYRQTLIYDKKKDKFTDKILEGSGEGSFIVIKGFKK